MADGAIAASRARAAAIVVVACAILFATNGFILAGLTVFDSRIQAELGVGNGALRLRDTITVATLGLAVPIVGQLIDRVAVRPILAAGLLLMAIGFAAYTQVTALWQVYAIHILFGLSQATSGVVACVYLVSGWTRAHRGLALGIMIAGSSLGNALVPAFNSWLLDGLPWRAAVLGGGIFAISLIAPLLLVVREPPRAALSARHEDGLASPVSLRPLLRSPAFVGLAIIAATTVFSVLALATNLALFVASSGGNHFASGPLLLFALFGSAVAAQIAAGVITYRVAARTIHVAAIAVMATGALAFALAPPGAAVAAITLFGLGWGANSTMLQVRPSLLFAGPALGRTLSLLALAETIGGGFGPAVAGYISDRKGGFHASFLMVAALMLVPLCVVLLGNARRRARSA